MLGRWRKNKNKLNDPDPKVRLAALEKHLADPSTTDQSLAELLPNESQAEIRARVIGHIQDRTTLLGLLAAPDTHDAAAKRLAQLCQTSGDTGALNEASVLNAFLDIASAADIPRLLPFLSNAEQTARLLIQVRGSEAEELRQHETLRSEAGLQTLERMSRNRDKSTNRWARNALDSLRAARTEFNQALERLNELDATLHKAAGELSNGQADQTVELLRQQAVRIEKLQASRAAVANTAETARQKAAHWLTSADELGVIPDAPAIDLSNVPDQDPFQVLALKMAPFVDINQVLANDQMPAWLAFAAEWDSHAAKFRPPPKLAAEFGELAAKYDTLRAAQDRLQAEAWSEADLTPPTAAAEISQWRRQWQQRLKQLRWPAGIEKPDAVHAVEAALEQSSAAMASAEAADAELANALQTALTNVAQAIDDGQYQDGVSAIKHARQLARQSRASSSRGQPRPQDVDRQLSTLSARLGELKDWQKFATNPKRQGLLDEIQKLAETPLTDLAQQGDRIRTLRTQWRELGFPSSAEERSQQEQFDALAAQAYEPCRGYYAEQDAVRTENLRQREALCEQLQAYLDATDWSAADFKAAEHIMRTAREEWRRHHPCNRKALKPVEARFEALQGQLYEHIKRAWDASVAQKTQILENAKALLENDDVHAQVEGAKQLQQQWRNVGPTPKSADQKLWREFRKVCDQIFQQRQAAHEAQRDADKAAQQTWLAAVDVLQQAADRAASAADATAKELDTLLADIDAAGAGVRLDKGMRNKLSQARDAYQACLAAATQRAAQAKLKQWAEWDAEVSAAEQAGETPASPHTWFNDRCQGQPVAEDLTRLTLQAEIAADLPSPESDSSARMALQVELMNAGFRNANLSAARDDMLARWCAAGPKSADSAPLRERFFAAMAKLTD